MLCWFRTPFEPLRDDWDDQPKFMRSACEFLWSRVKTLRAAYGVPEHHNPGA